MFQVGTKGDLIVKGPDLDALHGSFHVDLCKNLENNYIPLSSWKQMKNMKTRRSGQLLPYELIHRLLNLEKKTEPS